MSFSETAWLVGYSYSAVLIVCAKWINNSETRSRLQAVGHLSIIKEKGRLKLSRLVKKNQCQTVDQLIAQLKCRSKYKHFRTHCSQQTLLDMRLHSRCPA
ncbi:hypothetical protein TNCV_4485961 [Trichonephila clavipes]|nr:hypothetical protein TNCV_4485961 [Trichonephila clavipes]